MTFRETSWPGSSNRTFIHLDGNDDLVIRNGLRSHKPGDQKKRLEKWDWKIYGSWDEMAEFYGNNM